MFMRICAFNHQILLQVSFTTNVRQRFRDEFSISFFDNEQRRSKTHVIVF